MTNLGILEKVQTALEQSAFDAVLLAGTDHTRYLSGANLPFAPYRREQYFLVWWPKQGEPVCITPAEWASTVRDTSWCTAVRTYGSAEALIALLKDLFELLPADAKIGYDAERFSYGLFTAVKQGLPGVQWLPCDAWIKELRQVKTAEEIALLSKVAAMTDHGINGAIHHVTVDRRSTALTLAEELRVHTEERGIPLIGYHAAAHVAAGEETKFFWSNPPKFGYSRTDDLHPAEMVRMKIQTCLNGYWSDATRTMIQGEPSDEQSQAYAMLVRLRETALGLIKPGATCQAIFTGLQQTAAAEGITLFEGRELGHGIGVSPVEEPFLGPCEDTQLVEGMVLVLDPAVVDGQGQIWQSKDTIVVTKEGCRIVGWYKDWREPYIPIASI